MSERITVSFGGLDASISSMKVCKSFINNGMQTTTKVALDLIENRNDLTEVDEMEEVMLEYASVSRELDHYMKAVEDTVNKIKREKPENLPDLEQAVEEKFIALQSTNRDRDLQRNEKVVHFKEQLKQMKIQFGVQTNEAEGTTPEEHDEDITVTQSQMNFVCPITQMEMKKPVKNKICGHAYEEEAVLKIIQHKEQQRKKASCPTLGCNNTELRRKDLVPDEVLKRAIDSQSQQTRSTL